MTPSDFVASPFLERDGGVRMKLGAALVVMGAVGFVWMLGASSMLDVASLEGLARWRDWDPPGRSITVFGTILMVVVAGLAALLLGAASIAEERDRGTWREIVLLPLTPGSIVVGKAAAVMATLLPFAFFTAPLAAWGALVGDVGPLFVVGATLFVVVHLVFYVSLGLAISAHASSVRQASAFAVVAFAASIFVVVMPGAITFGQVADRGFTAAITPQLASLVAVLVAGALGSLLVARERIAGVADSGHTARRPLVFAVLVVVPIVLPLTLALAELAPGEFPRLSTTSEGFLVALATLLIVSTTALLDVSSSPEPRRTALLDVLVAAPALALGGVVFALCEARAFDETVDTARALFVGLAYAAPACAGLVALAGLAAFFSARLGVSAKAAVATVGIVVLTQLIAFGLATTQTALPTEGVAGFFLMTNPFAAAVALGEHIMGRGTDVTLAFVAPPELALIAASIASEVVVGALALAAAGAKRRRVGG